MSDRCIALANGWGETQAVNAQVRPHRNFSFVHSCCALAKKLLSFVWVLIWLMCGLSDDGAAQTLPPGFSEEIVFSGLMNPTAIEFSIDGRVFVAEKSGLIKVFPSLSATAPTIFADLRTKVHNFWDRGLLGMALHPDFPTTPYVYVLYAYDAAIGGTAPTWGTVNGTSDGCPTPPGPTTDGCVVSGRLSRLQAAGDVMTGSETVLIENWCQQFPSHSVGSIVFGPDGALYVSGGDGASFNFVDYGQTGSPKNPCGDPPSSNQTPPTAEGGALRSQSLERPITEAVVLNGAILRVDPNTGNALPDNPLATSSDANRRRTIAYGLRNPFRIATRPNTSEIWIGDVGWNDWEEINRIVNPTGAVQNFGWPCYEGGGRQSGYDSANLNICESLYSRPTAVTPPEFVYRHAEQIIPGENCSVGSSSITGLAFYNGGNYPPEYDGALFFADFSRNCIWTIFNPTGEGSTTTPVSTMNFVSTDQLWQGNEIYLRLWDGGAHPGNSSDAIRRWQAPQAGSISITGNARDLDTGCGSGVVVYIKKNSTILWQEAIANGNTTGVIYNLTTTVLAGENVDFGLNRGADNVWDCDATDFNPTIVFTPSSAPTNPITYNASVDFSSTQGFRNWYYLYSVESQSSTFVETFVATASGPVELKIGPNGDLFYVDFNNGTVRRIKYGTNQAPTAVIQAMPTGGSAPLAVTFNGTGSSDPDAGDKITYAWDLDGDGQFNDSTAAQPVRTYTVDGTYVVGLKVTDNHGASSTTSVTITVGTPNTPPTATINTPLATTAWKVGDVINFSGQGVDQEDGALPASALSWSLIIHHCPSNCHTHHITDFVGVESGSFAAPDHEYPSHLELQLMVTDSQGATDAKSVLIFPQTVVLNFQTVPSGLQLTVGSSSGVAPFSRTLIVGSANSISAPSPQTSGGSTYQFSTWSDAGTQTHNITAGATPTTYTATYQSTTTTAFPNSTTVLTGTLSSGTTAALTSDDNVYYAVNSTTTGTRIAAWYGSFTGVSKSLTRLRVNYKGNNSRNCTQTIAIWRWTTSAWVQLDSRKVGTAEVAINNLVPTGTLAEYVSGATGSGELRVRIQCQATANLTNRGDLMSIVYDPPPS
jgi:glucose/arabinose dehydrogenase/PKD repeat protein